MIKKHYHYGDYFGNGVNSQYFRNFLDSLDGERSMWDIIAEYKGKKAKAKGNHSYNVKWYDKQLYTMFVLRYS